MLGLALLVLLGILLVGMLIVQEYRGYKTSRKDLKKWWEK